ncbi:hypothetical protein E2C01_079007 [Portunus trituberculatus]|uniref:Uncharacterized protein n=1 Tax=Portunus trituberculatus TaxID=210409 RepID=A0A5B7IP72_PORTR|nr:hypothetical protein [Portunus trituberculatus]
MFQPLKVTQTISKTSKMNKVLTKTNVVLPGSLSHNMHHEDTTTTTTTTTTRSRVFTLKVVLSSHEQDTQVFRGGKKRLF